MSTANGVWQKTLVYLGLWEEPEAEQYDDLRNQRIEEPAPEHSTNVRPLRLAEEPREGRGGADRARTVVVEVTTFDDCEAIGRHHRDGAPVLFDLAAVDRTTARRVLDFVSGMTFALHGRLQKVSSRAFLLVPEGVEVAPEERARLEAHGYRFADGA